MGIGAERLNAEPPAAGGLAPTLPPPNQPTREYRAAVAFAISGIFVLAVLLLVSGAAPSVSPAQWAVALVGPLLLMLALLGTAYGLALRASWARAAMTPLLIVEVAAGVVSFVIAITQSTIQFPIGLILGIWALRARPATAVPPLGLVSVLVLGIGLVSAIWGLPAQALLQPGGPLIVDATALEPALTMTCEGPAGVQPKAVHIRYSWRWLRTEPIVEGHDVVILQVFHAGEDGTDYALGETEPLGPGISQEDISIFAPIGSTFGVDLAAAGFEPETVGFSLLGPDTPAAGSGSVDARATYVHGASDSSGLSGSVLWRVKTDVSCAW